MSASKLPEMATYSGSGIAIAASLASQYQPLIAVLAMFTGMAVGVGGLIIQYLRYRKLSKQLKED